MKLLNQDMLSDYQFKGVKMDYKMKLTEDEVAILNGEKGEVMAKVMKSLVMYGDVFNAKRMVEISAPSHFVTSFGISIMKAVFDIMDEINNAGITKDGLLMRMSEQQWDAVINVNLKSAFNFIHAVTPVMMRQRTGSIVNMSSVVGVSGNAGQANYSASKAGMIGLAKSVAKELGSRGVRANAIAPGFIITEMTGALSEEVRNEWAKQIPLRRGGTPEDVANAALFLASDLSSYVSGQVIHVCGGMNT